MISGLIAHKLLSFFMQYQYSEARKIYDNGFKLFPPTKPQQIIVAFFSGGGGEVQNPNSDEGIVTVILYVVCTSIYVLCGAHP
jgi:hypothetical protein